MTTANEYVMEAQDDTPICKDVTVELVGQDGNAFAILGKVKRAMQREKIPAETIQAYMNEAMSGDYDHLLQTTMKYVNVE